MNIVVKMAKGLITGMLILGLCFASAVFTVVLYANFTGQDEVAYGGDHAGSEAQHHSSETVAGQTEQGLDGPETDRTSLHDAWQPVAMLEDVPLILQYPELPRGCEVTSLTMMLQYADIDIDKMTLAEELPKDPTPIRYDALGISYWGHPNRGFVGDITLDSPGFGVYHKPLHELSAKYIPESIDLTGESFERLEQQISLGIPVVVWTTTNYDEPRQWVEWDTPDGRIRTTHQEHAVLLTGYDAEHVYFNDPLKQTKNIKVNKEQFIHSWEILGKQAISYQMEGI